MNFHQGQKNNGTVHTQNIAGVDGSADGRKRCCPFGPARNHMASRTQDAPDASASHERNDVSSAPPWVSRLNESQR